MRRIYIGEWDRRNTIRWFFACDNQTIDMSLRHYSLGVVQQMKKILVFSMVALAVLSQAQGGGGGRGGFGRGGGNSMTGLLNRPDVQAELKISDDQKTKLAELNPQRGGRGGGGAGGGGGVAGGNGGGGNAGGGNGGGGAAGGGQGRNFDPAEMQKMMAEREQKTLAILNADQVKRLKELYVQRVGNRALNREDIQKELGLSADQVAKIKDLGAKQAAANAELGQKVRNQEIDREQMREVTTKNNKILDEELGKVLTADQASKLKAMRGSEFKFEEDGN